MHYIHFSPLKQELKRLQDVLNAREVKLVEYSKQNISLQESISVYRK